MSPTKAGKPTDAATLARPAVHSAAPTPGEERTWVQDGSAGQGIAATSPHGPRRTSPPRVGRSQNSEPPPFDDPCIYLG